MEIKKVEKTTKQIFNGPHPLTNFEIQKFQNGPRFNGVYSRDNLPKTKDGAYITNTDSTLILELIGLLCMFIIIMLLIILILLVQNIFQKKLKHLLSFFIYNNSQYIASFGYFDKSLFHL